MSEGENSFGVRGARAKGVFNLHLCSLRMHACKLHNPFVLIF